MLTDERRSTPRECGGATALEPNDGVEQPAPAAIEATPIQRSPNPIPPHAPFLLFPQHLHLPLPPQILRLSLSPSRRITTPRPRHPNRVPTRPVYPLLPDQYLREMLPPPPRPQGVRRNAKPHHLLQRNDLRLFLQLQAPARRLLVP